MPFSVVEFVRTHRATSVRIAGLFLFLVAFALPAVRVGKHADMFSPTFAGYQCARIGVLGEFDLLRWPFNEHNPARDGDLDETPLTETAMIAASGLINLLVLVQCFAFSRRRPWVHGALATATAVCMVETWALFARMGIFPLIGHVLWIVGTMVVVAAGFVREASAEQAAA